ncbi:uncharacterized protein SPPG_06915 [Spizellomyces punctatus DAOM BR117]|uniref:SH3 domain-containing protein n=1 Tax=Spizellomyces punctatus (strain DAOM BR117) TaxID=645134 RepID=A0A0L0H8R4_SPIPD|nr:uncharacterized protein SPPG_06915 [Spizellomyces punctatus DAOM BR117]KNC97925.1 hypothetical protein SPPG_06915 [Spizellomyces punctatus DAOM BR117]|eukprot:XP_016605965.1 hypothetical protein SPPG_06915 [Spizellomyces punctatus DAOM BR117]
MYSSLSLFINLAILLLPFANAACTDVSTTAVCRNFATSSGLQIQTDGANSAGLSTVKNGVDFDNVLGAFTSILPPELGCQNLTEMMVRSKVPLFRFALSYQCQEALLQSSCPAQNGTARPVRLCRNTCNTFRDDMIGVGFNSVCGQSSTANAAREAWRKRVGDVCSQLTDELGCLMAVDVERNNCGYGNTENGVKQAKMTCQDRQSDCCAVELKVVDVKSAEQTAKDDASDKLPLFAGISGGFFFGIIALAVSILRWTESRGGGTSNKARASIHTERAAAGARASGMWPTSSPVPNMRPFGEDGLRSLPPTSYADDTLRSPAPYADDTLRSLPPTSYDDDTLRSLPPKPNQIIITNLKAPSPAYVPSQQAPPSSRPPTESYAKRTQSVASRYSMRTDSHTMTRNGNPKIQDFYRAVVTESYDPLEVDEVLLNVGDIVHVHKVFDDGWAYGVNTNTGQTGVFPHVCLQTL